MRQFSSRIPVKEIIQLYSEGYSSREVAKLVNSNQRTVLDVLCEHAIKRKSYDDFRKNTFDFNYFKIVDAPDKAYFLGFMYADGNVYPKNGLVQISLEKGDEYILNKFKECIKLSDTLKVIKATGETRGGITSKKDLSLFRISSKELCLQLINLGCIPAKSLILKFPTEEQVPKEFHSHFIRGVFDGDGCVSLPKNGQCMFSIIGTKDLVNCIQEVLIKECGVNKTIISKSNDSGNNTYTLCYCGANNLKRIKDYLYKDCEDLYLTRKKEKFDTIVPKKKEKFNKFDKSLKKKTPVPSGFKKVFQYTLDGDFVKEWNGFINVEKELGVKAKNISFAVTYSKNNYAEGYKWFREYKGEKLINYKN